VGGGELAICANIALVGQLAAAWQTYLCGIELRSVAADGGTCAGEQTGQAPDDRVRRSVKPSARKGKLMIGNTINVSDTTLDKALERAL
jgi:hypothetical protein